MESGPSFTTKPGDGRGGWRAALFIIAAGFFERIGFVGVSANLITYLTGPLGMSTAAAAAGVNAWNGTVQVLPLVGALAADSRLGRYRALMAACLLYLLSLGMLTVSSGLQTPHTHAEDSVSATSAPAHLAFFYVALYLLAMAQGFYGPCGEALGADQFVRGDGDPGATASRSSYFNWFHFSMSWGYAIASAGLSYVEDNVGWTVGFGACWSAMVLVFAIFLLGRRMYRMEQPIEGAPFVETVRAWVARVFRRKDPATGSERLLDSESEEGEGLVAKLFPIWATSLVFATNQSQVYTLFTKQSSTLDRRLGSATGIVVPPAALQFCISVTFIVVLPVYDRVLVPLARCLTGHDTGITMLQRIGASMAVSGVAMAVAALVETRRLRVAMDAGLVDSQDVAVPMSLWWVVPQYVLLGVSGVLGWIGLEEFFYDQMPDELRSVGLALSLSISGVGCYVSSMLVSAIDWATRRNGDSWFSDNLNRGHLDYFYWLLTGFTALELAVFLHFANRYVYKNKG